MQRNTSHNIVGYSCQHVLTQTSSLYDLFFFTSNNDKIWTWITIILCHRFPSMTYCSQISEILKYYQKYLICINHINLERLVVVKLLMATLIARKNYNLCDDNTYYIVCMVTDNQQVGSFSICITYYHLKFCRQTVVWSLT